MCRDVIRKAQCYLKNALQRAKRAVKLGKQSVYNGY